LTAWYLLLLLLLGCEDDILRTDSSFEPFFQECRGESRAEQSRLVGVEGTRRYLSAHPCIHLFIYPFPLFLCREEDKRGRPGEFTCDRIGQIEIRILA
jgi:hypothetical protein